MSHAQPITDCPSVNSETETAEPVRPEPGPELAEKILSDPGMDAVFDRLADEAEEEDAALEATVLFQRYSRLMHEAFKDLEDSPEHDGLAEERALDRLSFARRCAPDPLTLGPNWLGDRVQARVVIHEALAPTVRPVDISVEMRSTTVSIPQLVDLLGQLRKMGVPGVPDFC